MRHCRLSNMHTLSTNGWYSVTWKILVPSKPHVVAKKRLLLAVENLLEQQQVRSEESDLNYQAFQQRGTGTEQKRCGQLHIVQCSRRRAALNRISMGEGGRHCTGDGWRSAPRLMGCTAGGGEGVH
jgi:hypothetical protein